MLLIEVEHPFRFDFWESLRTWYRRSLGGDPKYVGTLGICRSSPLDKAAPFFGDAR
jgi:hypothetical protein